MTEEQQKIAAAEYLGWKLTEEPDGELILRDPQSQTIVASTWGVATMERFSHKLPDCVGDMNTRWEMLRRLSEEQEIALINSLWQEYATRFGLSDAIYSYVDNCPKMLLRLNQPTFCRHWLKVVGRWEESK